MQLGYKDMRIVKLNQKLISYVRIIYIFHISVYVCLRVIYRIYFKILIRIKRKLRIQGFKIFERYRNISIFEKEKAEVVTGSVGFIPDILICDKRWRSLKRNTIKMFKSNESGLKSKQKYIKTLKYVYVTNDDFMQR